MDDTLLDDLLKGSAPARRASEPNVKTQVDSLVVSTRAKAATGRRRLGLIWAAIPVLLVPGIAFATTAGTEPRMVPDYTIPISYTTDTGTAVSCTLEFFNGEIDYRETNTAQVDYLRAQDWTGIGQRIYDRALQEEPAATAGGYSAWGFAADELVTKTVPLSAFRPGDGGLGGNSDCTGQLH